MADIIGTTGADTVSVGFASAGVGGGGATDGADSIRGEGGDDVLSAGGGFDTVVGGDGDDRLFGSSGEDILTGGAGNDVIDGGAESDAVNYRTAPGGVSVTVAYTGSYGSTVSGAAGNDTLISVERVLGTDFADSLTALTSLPSWLVFLQGYGGNDTITGPASLSWSVVADYFAAPNPVSINLTSGFGSDGSGGTDSFANIVHVRGSNFADTIVGSINNDQLVGGGGNDLLDGGAGTNDYANYGSSTAAVTVNLATGIAQDGQGGTDTVRNIESVLGTVFNDTLTGDGANNTFVAMAGNNSISGGTGSDRVTYDFWQYRGSAPLNGIVADLTTGQIQNAHGGIDTVTSIERITGTGFADSMTGNGSANRFNGRGGNDTLIGGPGSDVAEYSSAGQGAVVNLTTGIASDGEGGTDTLDSFSQVVGSNQADTLTGRVDDAYTSSWLFGGFGNDLIRAPVSAAELQAAKTFVGIWLNPNLASVVDLELGIVGTAGGGTDTLENINGALVYGTSGHTVSGTAFDNLFETGSGADIVNGRGGFDIVDFGEDLAAGRTGVVVDLATGTATDSAGSTDTLISIEGAFGYYGADTLIGSDGDNLFELGAGRDFANAGLGTDTLFFGFGTRPDSPFITVGGGGVGQTAVGVKVNLGTNTAIDMAGDTDTVNGFENVIGSFFADSIIGSDGANNLEGRGGADTLSGGAGNDTLHGQAGADSLAGGADDDTYIIDETIDTLRELRLGGIDTVLASVTFALGFELDHLILTGSAAIDGSGNDLANRLTGNAAANVLNAGRGADTLTGGEGNDIYRVDQLDMVVEQAGGGADTVTSATSFSLEGMDHIEVLLFTAAAFANGTGSDGADFIIGNLANNVLAGGLGDDTLSGGTGDDTLRGGDGADSLLGGIGLDRFEGGAGNDTFVVADADTAAEGANAGTDLVLASASFTLGNHIENLTLTGAAVIDGTGNALANIVLGNVQANVLMGMAGADSLSGGNGNDTLVGGQGADTISGGNGLDSFRYDAVTDRDDLVLDYRAVDDSILVSAAGFGGGLVAGMNLAATGRFITNDIGLANAAFGQFIFETDTRILWWDADGTGANAAARHAVATLVNVNSLAASEISIIA